MIFKNINKKNIFLYLIFAVTAYILTFIIKEADADLWARLAVGSLFFQTGHVLTQDIFAYTPTKTLWIDHEWGSGVIFYTFIHCFGDFGLFILKFTLIFTIFLLVNKIIQLNCKKSVNIDISMLVLLAFAIFPSVVATVRSQLFTYTFFVLWICILEKIKRDDNRLLWIFPATMLIWVNLHGGFVTGLGLIIIYTIGEALNRKNILKYLKIFAITLPVTLINPYGINFWKYILEAISMQRPHIFEWQHFTLQGPFISLFGISVHMFLGFEIIAVLTIILAIKLIITKSDIDWTKILLIIITLYLGLKHQRHLVLFVLTAFSLLYSYYINIFKSIGNFIQCKHSENMIIKLIKIKNISIISILMLLIMSQNIFSTKIYAVPSFYPVGAIEFIKQNNLSGNLFVPYRWGSYAMWKLYPQCLVSVDGRYEEVYPDSVFSMAAEFSGDIDTNWHLYKKDEHQNENWQKFIDEYHTDIIIMPRIQSNFVKLKKLKNWNIAYADNLSYVLLPNNLTNKLYIIPDFRNPIYWHEDLSKKIKL